MITYQTFNDDLKEIDIQAAPYLVPLKIIKTSRQEIQGIVFKSQLQNDNLFCVTSIKQSFVIDPKHVAITVQVLKDSIIEIRPNVE